MVTITQMVIFNPLPAVPPGLCSYLGGDYYTDGNSYKLLNNCYDYDGEKDWIEEEYQEYGIIFQVNNLPNRNEIRCSCDYLCYKSTFT